MPPTIRLKAKVLVYFHQRLFLEIPQGFSFKNKFIYHFKQNILNFIKNNANFDGWLMFQNPDFLIAEIGYWLDWTGKPLICIPFSDI